MNLLLIIGLFILFVLCLPFATLIISLCVSGKYDVMYKLRDDGSWEVIPVMHPCGEPIDDEFIRQWHINKKHMIND